MEATRLMRILRVKNYEKYQNHRAKNPDWIKLYRTLLVDRDFLKLHPTDRYVYVGLLILASETDNNIVNDPSYIAHRLSIDSSQLNLTPLFRSGLLCASPSTLKRINVSQRERRERGETEREREAQAPLSPQVEQVNGRKSKALTEWPEEFTFNEGHERLASGYGLNVRVELGAFKDKAKAKGWMNKDWDSAFRTWIRKAAEFKTVRTV
jgi:hypothetical protein